jgi:hypothetical protein
VPDQQEHGYNDPAISSMEFLRAVMHDQTLPLKQRMDAAIKLLPLETPPIPTYYGEFSMSRTVALIIRIEGINGSVSVEQADSPGAPEVQVGFGPRDIEQGAMP